MTQYESIAFWIFVIMTLGFFAWLLYLTLKK